MSFAVIGLDHVQLAMPRGGEAVAEAFYAGLLGLTRLPKPEPQASRGGCWFARARWRCIWAWKTTSARPRRRIRRCWSGIWRVSRRAGRAAVAVSPNPDPAPGEGCYVDDPFGNRLELIDAGVGRRRGGRDGGGSPTKA